MKVSTDADLFKRNFCFISHGVSLGIEVNELETLEHLKRYLPPDWKPAETSVEKWFYIHQETGSIAPQTLRYQIISDNQKLAESPDLETILDALDSELRLYIGTTVKDRLFVHAGVVGWKGRAIVIPGRSFSGKTTLVKALVEAGATYYSDEYAVFDTKGFVHPYPRPLSVRQKGKTLATRVPVESFGGIPGTEPLPLGLLVHAQYKTGSIWSPRTLSSGEAVLALFDNTLVARLRPEFALIVLSNVISEALMLTGTRGEAKSLASKLLAQVEALT